jgi:hypothetical protein
MSHEKFLAIIHFFVMSSIFGVMRKILIFSMLFKNGKNKDDVCEYY